MSLNSFRNGFHKVLSTKIGYAIVALLAILLVFTFVYSGIGNNSAGGGPQGGAQGETIAKVNGIPITRGDFDAYQAKLEQQMQAFGQTITLAQTAQVHAEVLDELITAKLELSAAKKLGLTASDAEITKFQMDAIKQQHVAETLGLKPNASLTEINNAISQNGGQPLTGANGPLSDEAVRENILENKLQTYIGNKIVVTEDDAKSSFTQYHTRHILISDKTRSDVQAKSQADQVLAKAKAPGADFAALAKQYSEDPGTKNKGGDDGWIDQSTGYVPEFKDAAFALKPGQVTLIKSPQYGYFIIQLVATRSNLPKDFAKNPAKYIDQVKQQKQQAAWQAYLTSLKNDPANKIEITDPQLRGDRAYASAATESDPAKQQADYASAIADYKKALAAKPLAQQVGEINVQLAQIYMTQKQAPKAIEALNAALAVTEDPDLRMELGNLYLQDKQDKKAVEQFQTASKNDYDDQSLHQQLLMIYLQMKRPDLVKEERDWLKAYDVRQKENAAPAPTPSSSSATIKLPVGTKPGEKPSTPEAVKVVPSPAPAAATVKPASGAAPAPAKKSAQ